MEKAIEAAELALDAQMDVFLNHDNPFGFETFSPYKAAKIAIEAALAVLNQPQTEGCEDCYVSALSSDEPPCPVHGGGSGQGPSGVAEADLEGEEPSESEAVARVKAVMKAGRDAGSGVFDSHSVFRFGTHGVAALLNFLERDGWEVIHTGVYAQPGKWIAAEEELEDSTGTAPREAVADPNPDYGFDGRIRSAPAPQTEGENVCPECDGHCTDYSGSFACDTCSGKGKEKA